MSVVEIIQQKVFQLPPQAQAQVLALIEQFEASYQAKENPAMDYPLDLLAEIAIDGPADLAARHDFYAHSKAEE